MFVPGNSFFSILVNIEHISLVLFCKCLLVLIQRCTRKGITVTKPVTCNADKNEKLQLPLFPSFFLKVYVRCRIIDCKHLR